MKGVMVVDWLDKYGGAERVIALLQQTFNFSKTYTLINIMQADDLRKIYSNSEHYIASTKLTLFGKRFRLLFFTFPYLISRIKIDKDADLILSSSHSVAKGVKKSRSNQVHISYFQSCNANYIWDEAQLYFGKAYGLFYPLIALLRMIDIKQAQRPDYIICNSKYVKSWVKQKYGRESTVIYPPVSLKNFNLCLEKENYYVAVGRMAHIKRFDIAIEAFRRNKRKLILIGDGELYNQYKEIVPDNIEMPGFLNAKQVNEYLRKAKGFVQVGIEGFGIAAIEAQACGTPVIAYAKGGVLETIIDDVTGVFYGEQSPHSLNNAIEKFENMSFDLSLIRTHALRFSEERFISDIQDFIKSKIDKE